MEKIETINTKRLAWCMADRGLTVRETATESGVPIAALEGVLAGERELTVNQLRALGDYFEKGMLFFLEQGPVDETAAHTPQFRTLAQQKPDLSANIRALIERVERQREVFLSLKEDVDTAGVPAFKPPRFPDGVKAAAREARRWLGLSATNDFDSYRAAVESRGVLVFRTNGYQGKWQIAKTNPILGFALYDPVCPVIVVKKQDFDAPQSFTLMHELGHILLHRASSIDDDSDMRATSGMEREANLFAGLMLVPDEFLQTIDDRTMPRDVSAFEAWLKPQRSAWGVSAEVILRRLVDAGRLERSRYNEYRAWRSITPVPAKDGGNRMYRHREPKHIFGDPFVRVVLDALSARKITLARASGYLDSLKIKDLHLLEQHYAGA